MENSFFNKQNWYDDLCEYYNVTPDVALELGTRRPNRKPNLPSSRTTHAVSDLTFEEIWALKNRDSEEQIFQFYKDQGAWSAFRQVVRHKDMISTHIDLLSKTIRKDSTFCEYGCGVAPFTYTLLQNIDQEAKLNICISDVDCEQGFKAAKMAGIERVYLCNHASLFDVLEKACNLKEDRIII